MGWQMGKVIGGGLPVGAYGGRCDIMQLVAPAGGLPLQQLFRAVSAASVMHFVW